MSIFTDGFALSNFRSFGPKVQKIGPLDKINIFIGQNNSGKSNILLFLKYHLENVRNTILQPRNTGAWQSLRFEGLDAHMGEKGQSSTFGFCLTVDGENYQQLLNKYQPAVTDIQRFGAKPDILNRLLSATALRSDTNAIWFFYSSPNLGQPFGIDRNQQETLAAEQVLNDWEWRTFGGAIVGNHSGISTLEWIPLTLSKLSPIIQPLPNIELIPAIRRVGEAGTTASDFGGMGIIDRIARLQNPSYDQQHLKAQYEKINTFLRIVIGNTNARIEIPYDRDKINVDIDGRILPLSSLGTGVHEVIILAAAATVQENQILCIEEPELHLHPTLQRKLIRYFRDQTNNQYFITTHSAHLLDTANISIFHIRHHEGQSIVDPVYTSSQRSLICTDLGYRASDLLQANSVIWVEGPSDRLYLNHWIHSTDPKLVEGLHYSIMFYGGRLV